MSDRASPLGECDVAALYSVDEGGAVEVARRRMTEHGVTFELGGLHDPGVGDDRPEQIGKDVLGVIELDPAQIARVAADAYLGELMGHTRDPRQRQLRQQLPELGW